MCFEYDGFPDFYRGEIRRARKEYKCEAISQTIQPGDLYYSDAGLFEGSFYSGRYCAVAYCQRYLIHLNELIEGCLWSESWIGFDDLSVYMNDTDGQWISDNEAARLMGWFYQTQRLSRPKQRLSRPKKAAA